MKKKIVFFLIFSFIILAGGCREKFNPLQSTVSNDTNNSDNTNAAIEVLSPKGGDSFITGNEILIKWQIFGTVNGLKFQLFRDDQYVRTISQDNTLGQSIFSWTIPYSITSSSRYRIKIVDDNNTNTYSFSDTFTIIQDN